MTLPARHAWIGLVLALAASGCGDPAGPPPPALRDVGVVLNSVDISLTVFDVDAAEPPLTIGLAPDGSPVSMAVRGSTVVVPLGLVPAVAVVDLEAASVLRTIALPEGSGATGAAFVDDVRIVVANPGLGTVSVVNVADGSLEASVAVGTFPQAVLTHLDRVFVLNGELGPDFLPAGPGTVSVLDAATFDVVATVTLSGENPSGAAVAPDGLVYVVNAGRFFGNDGSLSSLTPVPPAEAGHWVGFGDFPGAPAFSPTGDLYVPAFSYGVAIWRPATRTFVRTPVDAIHPEGVPSTSGLGFDAAGRLYVLRPDCASPSAALRLAADYSIEAEVPVGICPIAIAFTSIAE